MERGTDFLKSQINNAVMQFGSFVENLEDHEKDAEDPRYRDLCTRYIPKMREHHRALELYQRDLGSEGGSTAKELLGKAVAGARDLADMTRRSDFLRVVGDIVAARQAEDTFKTFREAGKALGNDTLHRIGEAGERDMDDYVRDANRLCQAMFVEHVRGVGPAQSVEASLNEQPRL